MNRRDFCLATPLLLAGCGSGDTDMGQEFTLQPSPTRTNHEINAPVGTGYAHGIWVPEITYDGASGITYSSQQGSYTKIGRLVFIVFAIALTSKGTGGANPIQIEQLPFTAFRAQSGLFPRNAGLSWSNSTTSYLWIGSVVEGNVLSFQGKTAAGTSGPSSVTSTDIANNFAISGSAIYETSN